jgi:hypothetical protein
VLDALWYVSLEVEAMRHYGAAAMVQRVASAKKLKKHVRLVAASDQRTCAEVLRKFLLGKKTLAKSHVASESSVAAHGSRCGVG